MLPQSKYWRYKQGEEKKLKTTMISQNKQIKNLKKNFLKKKKNIEKKKKNLIVFQDVFNIKWASSFSTMMFCKKPRKIVVFDV